MLRIAGERIATPSVRTGFAMTEVFGSFRTYFTASCIEKHVIPSVLQSAADLLISMLAGGKHTASNA